MAPLVGPVVHPLLVQVLQNFQEALLPLAGRALLAQVAVLLLVLAFLH